MDIQGKVVIVTGASEGIGRATARLLTQQEAKVALVARSTNKLQQLAAELPGSLVVPTDMRDEIAIHAMVKQVQQHYGRIDGLVNNAGQGMHVPLAQANIDQYRALLELNVVGVLSAMQAVIPVMRAQPDGGVIINISSGTTKAMFPGVGPYASTKHALNALTQIARLELAPEHIRVGLVYPFVTATNFLQNAAAVQTSSEASTGRPVGPRAGEPPERVAQYILEAIQTEAPEVYADSLRERMR